MTTRTRSIVPAGVRSVVVRTYVFSHGTGLDERDEVWRGPWPEVEALVSSRDGAAYVSLNHAGERWCSILATSDNGWTCLGAEAMGRVLRGELSPVEAYFSTAFKFPRGVSADTPAGTRNNVAENLARIARWRAGDVQSLLWCRIRYPGGVLEKRDPPLQVRDAP